MELKAHGKINWALNIKGVLENGYHNLDMLTQRLALADTLTITPHDSLVFQVNGRPVPGDGGNLVLKAALMLKESSTYQGGALIQLDKKIPIRAGLGGGSADAAVALMGLNSLWGLGLSLNNLEALALKLGADVPLCLHPGLMQVGGIGETLAPLPGGQAFELLILQGAQGLDTAKVFYEYDLKNDPREADIQKAAQALVNKDPHTLNDVCYNQLQQSAIRLCPEVALALKALKAWGAAFVQMSGSGSAVFGVFENASQAEKAREALEDAWPVCVTTSTLPG